MKKSNKDCMIDGVCGGLAEELGVESIYVRFVFLLFGLVWPYIILMLIMPESED